MERKKGGGLHARALPHSQTRFLSRKAGVGATKGVLLSAEHFNPSMLCLSSAVSVLYSVLLTSSVRREPHAPTLRMIAGHPLVPPRNEGGESAGSAGCVATGPHNGHIYVPQWVSPSGVNKK